MNEERMKEVFSNEEFVKELFSKETPEEAQALLAEKEIEISVEELVKLRDVLDKKLQAVANGESPELTEEELAEVAGGTAVWFALIGVITIAVTVMNLLPYIDSPRRTW